MWGSPGWRQTNPKEKPPAHQELKVCQAQRPRADLGMTFSRCPASERPFKNHSWHPKQEQLEAGPKNSSLLLPWTDVLEAGLVLDCLVASQQQQNSPGLVKPGGYSMTACGAEHVELTSTNRAFPVRRTDVTKEWHVQRDRQACLTGSQRSENKSASRAFQTWRICPTIPYQEKAIQISEVHARMKTKSDTTRSSPQNANAI